MHVLKGSPTIAHGKVVVGLPVSRVMTSAPLSVLIVGELTDVGARVRRFDER